ncbi:NADP-dependent oxidoreductase domain-containing protein [Mycena pura]|uniref:NADP-dependent oxidoreductase domain-containing protein n=1 Tax=Mycena pura TaxID=153505 RepID=A0AAD6Y2V3_9AGAR|nr:NADP-dependent oxidoreductase domain-containing protein [Mycena pura]
MTAIPSLKLNTGALIPAIGLGAAAGFTPEDIAGSKAWILGALKVRHRPQWVAFANPRETAGGLPPLDTAMMYGTEAAVGAAVRESGIPREEIFVTSKAPWHHMEYIPRSFNESLSNLGLDYIDLYMLHWPQTVKYPGGYDAPTDLPSIITQLKTLEKIYATGKAKAIGVSNFSIKTLEQLFKTAKIVPAVNQIELNPYLAQTELVEYCKSKGIVVVAYSPTGHATVRGDPLIIELAAKYKVSPAQIILAWHVARGVVAVPKSQDPVRQKENITLPPLSAEDVAKITGLDHGERIVNKLGPDGTLYGWTKEQLGW